MESSTQAETTDNNIDESRSENVDEASLGTLNVTNPNPCELHRENIDMNTDNSSQVENASQMRSAGVQDDDGFEMFVEISTQNQTIGNESHSDNIDEASPAAVNVTNPNLCELSHENADNGTDNLSQTENAGILKQLPEYSSKYYILKTFLKTLKLHLVFSSFFMS